MSERHDGVALLKSLSPTQVITNFSKASFYKRYSFIYSRGSKYISENTLVYQQKSWKVTISRTRLGLLKSHSISDQ